MVFLASNGYRCIAHDRRGHGRSSQPGVATRWTPNLFSSERRTNEREDRFGAFPSEDLGFFLFEDRRRQEERCKLVAHAR